MAQESAVEVIRLARQLPRDLATREIARQLVAAAGSVGANIAEGHGRFTFGAYKNHLSIAKGSACEVDSWLDLLRRTGDITEEQESSLHVRQTSLVALLTSKIRALEDRAKQEGYRISEEPFEYPTKEAGELD